MFNSINKLTETHLVGKMAKPIFDVTFGLSIGLTLLSNKVTGSVTQSRGPGKLWSKKLFVQCEKSQKPVSIVKHRIY